MVTALAQFHHDVEQGGDGRGRGRTVLGQEREVFLENGSVVLLLNGCQLHLQMDYDMIGHSYTLGFVAYMYILTAHVYLYDGLFFGGNALLHIFLQPSQHHRLQNLEQHIRISHT